MKRLLDAGDGEAIYCVSRLTLTPAERERVRAAHSNVEEASDGKESCSTLVSAVYAGQAALALGAPDDAALIVEKLLERGFAASFQGRDQVLTSVVARLAPAIPAAQAAKLMEDLRSWESFYARRTKQILRAENDAGRDLDALIKGLADDATQGDIPYREPTEVLFDDDAARTVGQVIARRVRRGGPGGGRCRT